MKTKNIIARLLALLCLNSFAQPKSTLSIAVGPSLPIGKFTRMIWSALLQYLWGLPVPLEEKLRACPKIQVLAE